MSGKLLGQISPILLFLQEAGRRGGRSRVRTVSETERKKISARGGRSRWSGLDADQRGRIMARVRAKRRKS